MRIEELLEKKEQLQLEILRQLILQGGRLPIADLRKTVGLSRNAFEQYVEDLEYLCQVSKIPLKLVYKGGDLVLQLPAENNLADVVELLVSESIQYQLLEFLLRHKEFTIVQLVNEFMISESSVFRKIKELNRLLAEFGLQIKNGQWIGEEGQIRHFYTQLYRFLPHHLPEFMQLTMENQNFIRALEQVVETQFTQEATEKICRWMGVTRKRLTAKKTQTKKIQQLMKPYMTNALYQKIDHVVTLYFSRTSLEVMPSESMLFYSFFIANQLLDEETAYRFELLRSKKLPTAVVDVYVRETLLLYYRPRRLSIEMEEKIGYQLARIHNELYFFQGKIEPYQRDQMLNKQKHLLGTALSQLVEQLTALALKQLNQPVSEANTLQQYLPQNYANVLSMIDFYLMDNLQIGIDLTDSWKEPFYQLLDSALRPIIGVQVAVYQEGQSYDLILTAKSHSLDYAGQPMIYRLSEFASAYDLKEIKALVARLKKAKF
ncbi:helix-turn-helix domain-containing protein [Enterococcus sp. 669A]|uniref:Helix-turn-helix domain-containing protein n=1 Tax=Candidatus Enterococcus moelleringii TaxID=2815325 RepID=A0ABS3LD91_9ENTE|nr:helix-turn-helix domain-containing protein [Enterococcus sp. 669A]MBO1307599.1 helix-turn-helix domain-containing protein [Enterococcus sp. 669A]